MDLQPLSLVNDSFPMQVACDSHGCYFMQWANWIALRHDCLKTKLPMQAKQKDDVCKDEMKACKDEIKDLERELFRLASIYDSGRRDIGQKTEIRWAEDDDLVPGSLEGKQILSQMAVKRSTEIAIAMVIIDGDHFKFNSDLLLQGYAGGCFGGTQLLREVQEILPASMKEDVLTIVHVYASLERLVQSLARESLRKAEFGWGFIKGFNSLTETMHLIEAPAATDGIETKIKDQIAGMSKIVGSRCLVLGVPNVGKFEYFLNDNTQPTRPLPDIRFISEDCCFSRPLDIIQFTQYSNTRYEKMGLPPASERNYQNPPPPVNTNKASRPPLKTVSASVPLHIFLAQKPPPPSTPITTPIQVWPNPKISHDIFVRKKSAGFSRTKSDKGKDLFDLPPEILCAVMFDRGWTLKEIIRVRWTCRYFNAVFLFMMNRMCDGMEVQLWGPSACIPVDYTTKTEMGVMDLQFGLGWGETGPRLTRGRNEHLVVNLKMSLRNQPVIFSQQVKFVTSARDLRVKCLYTKQVGAGLVADSYYKSGHALMEYMP